VICHTTTNKLLLTRLVPFLVLSSCLANHLSAQSLTMASGNGQMVNSQFLTGVPLVVQARDSRGNPLPGVAISWAITAGNGTLPDSTPVTDANGQASTDFTATTLQPLASFAESTVTASSKYGSVNFIVITVPYLTESGAQATPPSVTLLKPAAASTLTASQGATLPDAVEVRVQAGSGDETNSPIPNVGVHMVNAINPSLPPAAVCNGPGGLVYTDATGNAKCDLVITGKPGESVLAANAGQFHSTPSWTLQISPGPACTYSIAPTSLPISSAGGNGSVTVTTTSACGWAAASNVDWITITAGASGTGSGTVSFSVGADAAGARTGTLTIAGQTFTVNQGSGGAGALTITTPADLTGGTVNQSYSATLAASGGIAPYTWAVTTGELPAGLQLNTSTGVISGAATAAGTVTFTATVTDDAGTTASQVFALTITTSSSTFVITNTSFQNGVVDQKYTQALTSSGGVITPFFQSPTFKVSGGALPDGLNIVRNPDNSYSISGTPTAVGAFAFTLTATDAETNTTSANFTITITGTTTSERMTVSPATLSFTVQLGSSNIPAAQQLSITGNSGVLAYTSVITTASGGSWLVAQNSTSGNTPGSITIAVTNYSNLQPGPYTGAVTISSAASNSPIAVIVSLTVLAAPSLTVSPPQITLSEGMTSGSNIIQQSIQVSAGATQAQDAKDAASVAFSVTSMTNAGGNWLSVSPSTGTTPATLAVSINSGGLAVGSYYGTITVTPTAGATQNVVVTLNVINPQVLSAAPTPVAFTYDTGAPTPDPQSVTVSSSTGPALSLSTAVATTDKGNWLSVSPTGGTTPLALSVSVNPAGLVPKTYKGTITVTASDDSVTPLVIPVTLTVTPAMPTITAIANAASGALGPIAPGELVTIFGSDIGPATGVTQTLTGNIGRTLADTQVFFDSLTAPILYTSAGQVNAIVPYGLAASSSTKLTVWYKGTASAADDLRVVDSAPGIFVMNAAGQGAIVNQDGTINSASNGAPVGSTVSIYATGEGQTNPPGITGSINGDVIANLPVPQLTVTATIGGLPAVVTYAGGAPLELAGLLQVNVTIPSGVATGPKIPVLITVGTASSQTGVTIAIHK
jgi:uncharacterized protein (TIGR03437 family)